MTKLRIVGRIGRLDLDIVFDLDLGDIAERTTVEIDSKEAKNLEDLESKKNLNILPENSPQVEFGHRRQRACKKTGDQDFDRFYRIFPKHKQPGLAKRALRTALKKAPIETIIAGAEAYARHRAGEDPAFTCYPATWLNGERWLDEHDDQVIVNGDGLDRARKMLQEMEASDAVS